MKKMLGVPCKPDPDLNALLEKAKGHVMTADERFEQAVSFVYGQLMDCARPPTKEQVRKQLAEHYGREPNDPPLPAP